MKASGLFAVMLSCAMVAGAQEAPLKGRQIVLKGGSQTSVNVPVSLPYKGAVPAEQVKVVEPTTAKEFPVSIRNGEFVFVSEGALPGTEHKYEVAVGGTKNPPVVSITKVEGKEELEIRVEDQHFTTYHYSNSNKKPFLWPVIGEGGVKVTRDWPMGEKEQSDDHPHQKSIWSAYGNVNGADCWTEGDKSGYQMSGDVQFASGDAYGWITAKNVWQNNNHEPVVTEEREYRFYGSSVGARIFDETITFIATNGDVKFQDTKEGGIVSVRVRDVMTEKNGGTITNAVGGKGMNACWGKPAAWCDYTGAIPDAGVRGIALFDHPTNLRHPSCWHVRDYGLMGANCFGYAAFTNNEKNGDYTLEAGKSMTFKYRVYIHSDDAEKAKVADRYADFATPPEVKWIDAAK